MTIEKIAELLEATAVCGNYDGKVEHAFASDLMSDVLTLKNGEDVLLITGLCNVQTVRTAEMANVKYILFVRNKQVTPQMIEIAQEETITLLQCKYSLFRAAGTLFVNGVKPLY